MHSKFFASSVVLCLVFASSFAARERVLATKYIDIPGGGAIVRVQKVYDTQTSEVYLRSSDPSTIASHSDIRNLKLNRHKEHKKKYGNVGRKLQKSDRWQSPAM